MIPRFTLDDARRDIALDRHTFDPGPLLLILRNPVPPRRLQYVVTWEEWNAEAERRGYDAEVQHTPIGDFVRVRSKPGWWKERNDAYKAWLAATERQQEFRPRYPRKRRGQAARAEARARSGTTRAFSM